MNADSCFRKTGMRVPEIWLPEAREDMTRWAVIACDQYSSEPEYWEEVRRIAGDRPSAVHLIFPECYLEDPDKDLRIHSIRETMDDYLRKGVLRSVGPGMVLVKRTTPDSPPRWGLVTALDLEAYDYSAGSRSLIRATEGTILDRIPPRRQIREGARLELPHIMVLLDDPEGLVIPPLAARPEAFSRLYDFELMLGSGHLSGYLVSEEPDLLAVGRGLCSLMEKSGEKDPFLYAMGDGNHSLATAKAIWEDVKKTLPAGSPLLETHPARYALVELVNLYDPGIIFQPIHRVIFRIDPARALEDLIKATGALWVPGGTAEEIAGLTADPEGEPRAGILSAGLKGILRFPGGESAFPTGLVQDWLDRYLPTVPQAKPDYIHGWESVEKLASPPDSLGILLPAIRKSSFFETVRARGVFPRKTFSMGESREKRFYVESRIIRTDALPGLPD